MRTVLPPAVRYQVEAAVDFCKTLNRASTVALGLSVLVSAAMARRITTPLRRLT